MKGLESMQAIKDVLGPEDMEPMTAIKPPGTDEEYDAMVAAREVKNAETTIQNMLVKLYNDFGIEITHIEVDLREYANYRTNIQYETFDEKLKLDGKLK